jgi:gluconolactonase
VVRSPRYEATRKEAAVAIAVHSEKLRDLVDEGADVEQVATGFTFTEGPIWMPDGSLHFSDMPADKRRRWHPAEGVEVLRDPSNKCNGMTLDKDGFLIVCEHVTSSVVRERADGAREVLASHWGSKYLNSPNDVIVASDGSILFTDPTYGRMPGFGIERAQELDFQGVYRVPPDRGELQLLLDDFAQPNGLCFSPDESLLYVNDTDRAHIRVFEVGANHALANGRVFAENIGDGDLAKGGLVDGMKVDERGNVYVTGPDGVWVFSPEGEHLGVIQVPESVGNINWGGEDWSTLYMPSTTSIYRVSMKVSGNRLGYMH